MLAPVCGLRAVRAFRWAVLNVPNPTNATGSPFFSDLVMPSISESTAAAARAFEEPVSLAIFVMSSCLFMWITSYALIYAHGYKESIRFLVVDWRSTTGQAAFFSFRCAIA